MINVTFLLEQLLHELKVYNYAKQINYNLLKQKNLTFLVYQLHDKINIYLKVLVC
jgi:hypothetical protein